MSSGLWIYIDADEYAKQGEEYIRERIAHFQGENDESAAQYRAAAQEAARYDDDLDIDEDAVVSIADGGAWVQSWTWIEDEDNDEEGETE